MKLLSDATHRDALRMTAGGAGDPLDGLEVGLAAERKGLMVYGSRKNSAPASSAICQDCSGVQW